MRDGDKEKKMFKVCGNMDLLQIHVRLQGKWKNIAINDKLPLC
jgi:hypothetical protein